ncbi:adenylosuccinate synthetase [Chryseobacterium sp.]|uniref:adenylosuccinate synthetase n=1 Tax=Chryseobacterium sp. TaxID=1871047 RepID=UPI003D1141B1
MVKKAFIVVGLGYGDEGKGIATDFLASKNPNSIIIRFNGGHQAGHCVVDGKTGKSHVFSNLGAGTFRGLPTYWSEKCTFAPTYFLEEIKEVNTDFKFYINCNSPITTHYDVLFNRTSELSLGDKRKGSCGVGFGATIERNRIIPFTISDLLKNEEFVVSKLQDICNYYKRLVNIETSFDFDQFDHYFEDLFFREQILNFKKLLKKGDINIVNCNSEIFEKWDTFIFEGSQGILIDQNFGTIPHITKSNTTSQNAIDMIQKSNLNIDTEIFYVTRVYQTRHGNGPFKEDNPDLYLVNNLDETNVENLYQGKMRSNFLDIDDLKYALNCDKKYSQELNKNLLITCIDHMMSENIKIYINGKLDIKHYSNISSLLGVNFKNVFYSKSKLSENIYQ